MKERNIQELEEIRKSKEQNEMRLSHLRRQFDIVKFWEGAFGSGKTFAYTTFRSFVFDKAIAELNTIFTDYMERLSPKNSSLSVTLTSELKLEESYGKRSSGERKRTDLVTLFALFELVRQQSRYHPEFMILDEVFDSLDKEGQLSVQNVVEMLSRRLKKVFVITHSDIISEMPVAGIIECSMKRNKDGNPEGTEVIVQQM